MSDEIFRKNIGNRIREARKAKGLTMKDLGEKVGLAESTIQRYEIGKIKSLDTDLLNRIAIVLEVKNSYLVGWDNNEKISKENSNVKVKELVNKILALSDENRKLIETMVDKLIEKD